MRPGPTCAGPGRKVARLAVALHPALAEEQPVEGHVLLGGEGDEEVGVRRGAVLVPVDVLLEDAEIACELALGPVAPHLSDALGKLSLPSLRVCAIGPARSPETLAVSIAALFGRGRFGASFVAETTGTGLGFP